MQWDPIGYYSYLPATFIEKDLALSFITPENEASYHWVKYGYTTNQQGDKVIKYSMGVALLCTPFFLIAHSLALLGFDDANGFSAVYQFFLEFSSLFYLLIGFVYLRKLLLNYYSEKIIAIVLTLLYFGTNLLYHSAVDAVNPHVYSFSLFSVFLYFIHSFYKEPTYKRVIQLGLVFGLIVLVRPLNLFLIIPLLFYNVFSLPSFKQQLQFLYNNKIYCLVFLTVTSIVISPQLVYYKFVTGNYLLFSYGSDEHFYFNQPHVFDVLFSFRKGWFIYTPMMFVVLLTLVFYFKKVNKSFSYGIVLLLCIYLFFVSTWWCWWYGGSFGQRVLIDVYPILSFPLAVLVAHVLYWKQMYYKRLAFCGLGFLVVLNCFQTLQAKYNIIDWDGMTYKEYMQVFGSINPEDIRTDLLKKPDYEKAVRGLPEE